MILGRVECIVENYYMHYAHSHTHTHGAGAMQQNTIQSFYGYFFLVCVFSVIIKKVVIKEIYKLKFDEL